MDFNSGNDLLQPKTKGGQGKYNLGYLKITKQWSSKPIKVKKDKKTLLWDDRQNNWSYQKQDAIFIA